MLDEIATPWSIPLWLAQVLLVASSPVIYRALGERVTATVERLLGARAGLARQEPAAFACLAVVGLLVHLTSTFGLAVAGVPLPAAFLLPLAAAALPGPGRGPLLAGLTPRPGAGFGVWLALSLVLGASLFDATAGDAGSGVRTVWTNNTGDLAFHMGMISSFALGGNFPPEYPVFAGETLSYPLLVNLWSAGLWWPSPGLVELRVLFALQWTALWCVVWAALDGGRKPLLPFALLLGGGSFFALGHNSGTMVPAGYGWTVFLTTVWVTQRAALLGTACALVALWLFHRGLAEGEDAARRPRLALSALVFALSPLAHVHICGIAGLYALAVLGLRGALQWRGGRPSAWAWGDLRVFALFASPAVLFLPWLVGKAHTVSLIAGWTTGAEAAGGLAQLGASATMWIRDGGVWLALVAVVWVLTRQHLLFIPLALLFALGNFVELAVWDWDQVKLFIGLYAVSLSIWSATPSRSALRAHWLAAALLVPALVECAALAWKSDLAQVYSAWDVALARALHAQAPRDAVIAAAPRHDSPVTLAGRKLFLGYPGTLVTHGLPFSSRLEVVSDLQKLVACTPDPDPDVGRTVCPDHLLWTRWERLQWRTGLPGAGFVPTDLPELYRIERGPPD